jgi:3-isopropylmalate dehydratase small subunit
MAKKKKEEVTEEVTQEKVDNVTKVDLRKTEDSNITKVDLSKKPEEVNETKEEVVENNVDDGGVVDSLKTPTPQKNK